MKRHYFILIFLCLSKIGNTQDSTLLLLLEDSLSQTNTPVLGTFKATQVINMPTIETPPKGGLQFMIMHRFGRLNAGGYELFGLDNATIRFGLDYGLTNRFSLGVGRSSFEKTFDGSFKWKLFQQREHGMPVSISLYGLIAYNSLRYSDKPFLNKKLRTSYTTQSLIAKKISSELSIQLTPTWIHLNLVPTSADKNDLFAFGIGGRYKFTNRVSVNAEYNYVPDDQLVTLSLNNSLSFGLDIETGGHVFQLVFTNSQGMAGTTYLTKTTGKWSKGDIYFGFNVTRAFTLRR